MIGAITGQVQNGVVVLDEGSPPLAEGTWVCIEALDLEESVAQLSKALVEIAGTAEGLPPDLAEQHDHFLHGQPRR